MFKSLRRATSLLDCHSARTTLAGHPTPLLRTAPQTDERLHGLSREHHLSSLSQSHASGSAHPHHHAIISQNTSLVQIPVSGKNRLDHCTASVYRLASKQLKSLPWVNGRLDESGLHGRYLMHQLKSLLRVTGSFNSNSTMQTAKITIIFQSLLQGNDRLGVVASSVPALHKKLKSLCRVNALLDRVCVKDRRAYLNPFVGCDIC